MSLIQLTDSSALVRDLQNNGIVNTNVDQYNNYLKAKQIKEDEVTKIESIENDINCLKNDLCVIKQLLLEFKNESRNH